MSFFLKMIGHVITFLNQELNDVRKGKGRIVRINFDTFQLSVSISVKKNSFGFRRNSRLSFGGNYLVAVRLVFADNLLKSFPVVSFIVNLVIH